MSAVPAVLPTAVREAVPDAERIRTRAIDRHAYASDASHYLHVPDAVVIAADAAEVAAIMRASAGATHVTFRSGGTSLSGQASGDGILVDVRRGFRRIDVLDGGKRVRVQPGATMRAVNARLARYGHRLGPDPASEAACTIGGVVANNSSGMACGTAENSYRTIESLVLVLPSGTTVDTGTPDADALLRAREPALVAGLERLRDRVRANPASVAIIERQFALKNTMGYGINAFLDFDRPADLLAHLVIGSEGTLAFVAEATFRTVPLHPLIATTLAVFPTLDDATRSLPDLVGTGAATLELMDATSLRVGQELPGVPDAILGFEVTDQAALLVEYHADGTDQLAAGVAAGEAVLGGFDLRERARFRSDAAGRAAAWKFRKGLYASVAGARPSGTTALLEDVVVPVQRLAATCASLQELFASYDYRDSVIFGHAKDGNIHFMLTDRFGDTEAERRYLGFTEEMVQLVLDAEGNLKAEHGTGRVMAPYVRRQYGDELYDVMVQLKRLCDPRGVLNPGVIITEDAVHLHDIKPAPSIEAEVDRCVECGYCEPVCPSKDLTLTPRQRIVVRRAMAVAEEAGDTALVAELEREYDYDGVQTCAVDGMCQTTCPVLINTGALVKRLRRQDANPVLAAGWKAAAQGWGPVSSLASAALSVANAVPAPLVTRVTDLARTVISDDVMPRYTGDLPRGGGSRRRHRGVRGSGEVRGVYLPACVNEMFGAEDGGSGATDAFLQLLDRAGVAVVVPDGIGALCCGTPWSSKGYAGGLDVMSARVLATVREASHDGELPIISDASSCTEGFHRMLDGAGFRIEDATTFIAREALPRLSVRERIDSLTLHPTCSSVQLGIDADVQAIAAAVAETVNVPVSWNCCGFAGDRGMLHPELTASATAAEAAEVRALDATEHASCNRTCELGLARATGKPYRHILELLATATA
ncbi:FAD-binding and (Fe-S)-binding domain-containing protein [Microbacterium gorillae]|uniref:FAD-binding and (Fe-S)-binding domain-containing protein n=1 Tax=Microbacterium gorillae TaxID=1231063 RepID=UPI00058B94FC|nr:FAD-binding and (Fe-S)-binding domain-containing protein [Microbacterium gorillae]